MRVVPLGERVLLRKIKREERTAAGIYIPESAGNEKKEAIVEEVGDLKDSRLKKGDRVLYGGYSGEEFEIDGDEFLIIDYKDILARLDDGGGEAD